MACFLALVFSVNSFALHSAPVHRSHSQKLVHASTVASENASSQLDLIHSLSESSTNARGTAKGLQQMEILSSLCSQRLSFDFDNQLDCKKEYSEVTLISKLPNLLPEDVTRQLSGNVGRMLKKGWLSTNPDSVDGLPSFHLNLVSNGKPITIGDDLDEFQQEIRCMLDPVGPHIYDVLLPHVKANLGSNSVEVSDIFIRRYGQDVLEGKSRNRISAHYDVFSR